MKTFSVDKPGSYRRFWLTAAMVELVDTRDLKSLGQ